MNQLANQSASAIQKLEEELIPRAKTLSGGTKAAGERVRNAPAGKDGITYLLEVEHDGLEPPLPKPYIGGILKRPTHARLPTLANLCGR